MIKNIFIISLIVSHLLNQSAFALEFQARIIQPILPVSSLKVNLHESTFADRLVQRNVLTQHTEYTYDIADQPTRITNSIVGIAGVQRDYTYGSVDNRTSKAENIPGLLPPVSTGYVYNNIYEVTQVTGVQGLLYPVSAAHNFSYDKVANRTNVDGLTVTHNPLNQYVTAGPFSLTHDVRGNTTNNGVSTFTYDEENRLITANNALGSSTYLYDAFNRRVAKTIDGNSIFYIHDGDQIVEERDASGNLNATFLYGNGIDEILLMYRAGNLFVYHHDALGSVDAIVDWAGNPAEFTLYDVYGNPSTTNSSIGNPFLFTGRQFDPETGLYYYRNRMYDPNLGRFLQRDPIGYVGGINLYQYVSNSPNNKVDPHGLFAESPSDYVSWQLSLYFFSTQPSLVSGAALAFDSAMLALPGPPAFAGYLEWAGKGASAAAKAAPKICKQTTVIGHFDDVMNATGSGRNILKDPRWEQLKNTPEKWWNDVNKPWLDKAIKRGDHILLATDPTKVRMGSWFEKELDYLRSHGYVLSGNYMVKP